MRADWVAGLAGMFGLAMVVGALFFQYVVDVAPCEVCYWQRYPHVAAAVIGLGGVLSIQVKLLDRKWLPAIGYVCMIALAIAGILGIYHSGVEWRIWAGPEACTGDRIVFSGDMDLNAAPVVRCDVVSWRFLGVFSLANLNAIFSLGAAVLGWILLKYPHLLETLYVRYWVRRGG